MDAEKRLLTDIIEADTGPYTFYRTARSPARTSNVIVTPLHKGIIGHDLHGHSGEARLPYAIEASSSATMHIRPQKIGSSRHAHVLAQELGKPVRVSRTQDARTSAHDHTIRHESG